MTFGPSATAQGNLDMLGSPRSCSARVRPPHSVFMRKRDRHSDGGVDRHAYEILAPPACSSSTSRNWQLPDLSQDEF